MGSPISPIVTKLFIKESKIRAFTLATHPPWLWLRHVDDNFVIQKVEHSNLFIHHINSTDPHIQFTQDTPNIEGSISSLDPLVSQGPDNNLLPTVYRKPIHTDQYLHWDSFHNLSAKSSVFNTLKLRVQTACANPQLLQKEEEH